MAQGAKQRVIVSEFFGKRQRVSAYCGDAGHGGGDVRAHLPQQPSNALKHDPILREPGKGR